MSASNSSEFDLGAHRARLNDPRRLSALASSGMMDSPQEEAFDRAARLASRITETRVGLLSFVDGERQFFKAQSGLDGPAAISRGTPLSHSFCQYVVATDKPLRVDNARTETLLRDNLAIPDLGVIAYLGVPVHAADGEPIGALCAIDPEPRAWTEADLSALLDLASMLETEISLRETDRSRKLLVAELDHRIKNLFSMAASIVRQSRHGHDDVSDYSETVQSRLSALAAAHALVIPSREDDTTTDAKVPFADLLATILDPHVTRQDLRVSSAGPAVDLGKRATASLALVLHELATNAVKYGALATESGQLEVRWSLDTRAMTLVWREEETNGTGADNPPGFGETLIAMSVEGQLGGALTTEFGDGGMERTIVLPVNRLQT